MPFRYSIAFHFASDPKIKSQARPHAGGWTEQIWSASRVDVAGGAMDTLLNTRANFLPIQATIIGVRIAEFEIDGNKLIPKGSGFVKTVFPGTGEFSTNVPQDCMKFSGGGDGVSNRVKYTARCFPDEGIENGEFNGNALIKTRCTSFANKLVKDNWKTIGRDLSQPLVRIDNITNGVMVGIGLGGVVQGDFIRLIRVKDTNGDPVKGVFRIATIAGSAITLSGIDTAITVRNSGHFRKDAIALVAYASLAIDRVGVKKIGSPLEKYVGRQSKRTA